MLKYIHDEASGDGVPYLTRSDGIVTVFKLWPIDPLNV